MGWARRGVVAMWQADSRRWCQNSPRLAPSLRLEQSRAGGGVIETARRHALGLAGPLHAHGQGGGGRTAGRDVVAMPLAKVSSCTTDSTRLDPAPPPRRCQLRAVCHRRHPTVQCRAGSLSRLTQAGTPRRPRSSARPAPRRAPHPAPASSSRTRRRARPSPPERARMRVVAAAATVVAAT